MKMVSYSTQKEIDAVKMHIPHVSSPFISLSAVVGTKDMAISLLVIWPVAKRLSVTVGIVAWVSGERVPITV